MLAYDFGPNHPLRPDQVRLTLELLSHVYPELNAVDPGVIQPEQLFSVHDEDFVSGIRRLSQSQNVVDPEEAFRWGIGTADTPAFEGIYEASLAYCAGSLRAAEAVCDGEKLAFALAGGLHHARKNFASGFCVFNDCALACEKLTEKFEKVAYVDIDVHHGEGVEFIFDGQKRVFTLSIHQKSPGFYPGTGGMDDCGELGHGVNMPIGGGAGADSWLIAFEKGIFEALKVIEPGAIVLQMGADSHFSDPLANINNTLQNWIHAIKLIKKLGVPIVALGGGGYNLESVPRMWAAAVLVLAGKPVPRQLPAEFSAIRAGGEWFDSVEFGVTSADLEVEHTIERFQKQRIPMLKATISG